MNWAADARDDGFGRGQQLDKKTLTYQLRR
jgi:hypothetical protein